MDFHGTRLKPDVCGIDFNVPSLDAVGIHATDDLAMSQEACPTLVCRVAVANKGDRLSQATCDQGSLFNLAKEPSASRLVIIASGASATSGKPILKDDRGAALRAEGPIAGLPEVRSKPHVSRCWQQALPPEDEYRRRLPSR